MFTGTCIICGNPVKPKLARIKVAKTCSRTCMGKMLTGSNNPHYGHKHTNEIKQMCRNAANSAWSSIEYRDKISTTRKNSDSVINHCRRISHLGNCEEAKLKERFTNETNGRWIPLSEKTDFQLYKRDVWRFTRKNIDVKSISGYEYRGKAGTNGAYHLDHKFSLLQCFKQNIPIEIAGSLSNLEFIPWELNDSKNSKCSITKEELYEQFAREGDAKPYGSYSGSTIT